MWGDHTFSVRTVDRQGERATKRERAETWVKLRLLASEFQGTWAQDMEIHQEATTAWDSQMITARQAKTSKVPLLWKLDPPSVLNPLALWRFFLYELNLPSPFNCAVVTKTGEAFLLLSPHLGRKVV